MYIQEAEEMFICFNFKTLKLHSFKKLLNVIMLKCQTSIYLVY